jgi:hypothetical protein
MANRKALLNSLLRSLVEEWGEAEVRAALYHVSDRDDGNAVSSSLGQVGYYGKLRIRKKPLAIEQVARAQLPDSRKAILAVLATRFDAKQFLPTISDVREFLILMGAPSEVAKDRSDAFRFLLKFLAQLPSDRLEKLVSSMAHSGPSQLGPLSDAISGVAASLPRYREPSTS